MNNRKSIIVSCLVSLLVIALSITSLVVSNNFLYEDKINEEILAYVELTEEVTTEKITTTTEATTTEPTTVATTRVTTVRVVEGLAERKGNVSQSLINIANEELNKIPSNVLNKFESMGWHIYITDENIAKAVEYAHVRNVKIHLALNTLIKNNELDSCLKLANYAYEIGVDAIIVQDLGLAKILIKSFPKMPIHASTQMTIHNLEGVLQAEKLGFSRVILSRELSLSEIEYICRNSNIEIECFIHGALCISYSGECLFSSMIGGRSANRGKCAQVCRLPYELLEDNSKSLDKGYLLSPRDLCSLDLLPTLVNLGIKCFKIEGRLKNPEYVSTVTRIYRKYIDLAESNKEYIVDEKDKEMLMQIFNRGGFSTRLLKRKTWKRDDVSKKTKSYGTRNWKSYLI